MPEVEVAAVLVATVAAFASAGVLYGLLGEQLATVSPAAAAGEQMAPWKLGAEFLRCAILAAVVAGLASRGGIDDPGGGLVLGLALWVGFPFVLWTGALIHENTPPKLALIHGGDWLVKLLLVSEIVAVWP